MRKKEGEFEVWYKKYLNACKKYFLRKEIYFSERIASLSEYLSKLDVIKLSAEENFQKEKILTSISKLNQELKDVGASLKEIEEKRKSNASEIEKKIRSLPLVSQMVVNGGTLRVITKNLTVQRVKAGMFAIEIRCSDLYPRIWNLTYRVDEVQQHPNVSTSGSPCFGDYESTVEKTYFSGEIPSFVSFLLFYLTDGVNSENGYNSATMRDVIRWAKEKEYA